MAHSLELKSHAKKLRRKGYSIKEVSRKLKISQSTSSVWIRNEKVSQKGKFRLKERKLLGQYRANFILLI